MFPSLWFAVVSVHNLYTMCNLRSTLPIARDGRQGVCRPFECLHEATHDDSWSRDDLYPPTLVGLRLRCSSRTNVGL
jgi:hypothetical protein